MANKHSNMPVKPRDANSIVLWIEDALRQLRLAWRLFWDNRVPFWTKLIPMVTLVYLLSPIDLIPDLALGLGQLDDLAAAMIGLMIFIDSVPAELRREHLRALGVGVENWRVVDEEEDSETETDDPVSGQLVSESPPLDVGFSDSDTLD
ncbi:MAG: DUF1232 domain-containing protein [Chloroflexi bacterium]|nr:DUF1232 domain-containing protein [Chloroflexota bacterium]